MQFGVLGPIEVLKGGEVLRLGGARRQALVGRLLVDANRPVPADRLIEDIWEGQPPTAAAATLQSHISNLRRLLGSGRIVSNSGGYAVVVGDDELDAAVFEAEVAEAASHLAAGTARTAVDVSAKALSRWRGPPFGEHAAADWARPEVARLDGLRQAALESFIEAHLAVGDHTRGAAAAEAAVADYPLRERLWGLLMTALYRAGRQAEALRAYQRLRSHLADELGIEPSPELRGLEHAILEQDPQLAEHGVREGVTLRHDATPAGLPTGVVTFLLTDIVGSTRLWETAAATMPSVLARHDEFMRHAVEAHGGVLLKARGEGDSTFSVFRRATDAIAAALDAQQAMRVERWPTNAPVGVRMAVHTGEAVERDGDYYGRSVNRVARLRTIAGGGQIVVSRAAADVVVDHLPDRARLIELGARTLPDLERPEIVFELTSPELIRPAGRDGVAVDDEPALASPPVRPDPPPLPPRLAAVADAALFTFVGRRHELSTLHQALADAVERNRPGVVLIGGEPGAGKTRLVAEFARALLSDSAGLCFGSCENGVAAPYGPWIAALSNLLQDACEVLAGLNVAQRAALVRLIPALDDQPGDDAAAATRDSGGDRFFLMEAVVDALAAVSTTHPVVVVLDDIQWADVATLHLLRHVATSGASMRVLLLGTYRSTELSAAHPLAQILADLRRDTSITRVELAGLDAGDIAELVRRATPMHAEPDAAALTQTLQRETDGNAFFVTELLRDGHATVPASVIEVVEQRVARLGEDAARVLSVASVIGQEFDVDLLARVGERDPDEVLDLLEDAAAAALVSEVDDRAGRFRFTHALIQHALYHRLGAARRQRAHRRVAEALEHHGDGDVPAAELAHHWLAAVRPADVATVADYCQRAGDAALAALAPADAAGWYERSLQLLSQAPDVDDRRRGVLLTGLGEAQRQAGNPEYRVTILAAGRHAELIGDTELLVAAALSRTPVIDSYEGVDVERLALVEAALSAIGDADTPARARLLATLAADYTDPRDWERASALAAEALDVTRRLGDSRTSLAVFNTIHNVRCRPDLLEERLETTTRTIRIAAECGDGVAGQIARYSRVLACIEAADISEVDHLLAEMASFVDIHPLPFLEWQLFMVRSVRRLLAGDLVDAELLAERSLAAGTRAGQALAPAAHTGLVARIRREQGRLGEAIGLVAQVASEQPQLTNLRALLVVAYSETARHDEARQRFQELAADDFTSFSFNIEWLDSMTLCADVAADLGHRDAAEVLYRRLEPYASHVACLPVAVGSAVARPLGRLATLLGHHEQAEANFRLALEVHERLRAPYWTARTQLEYAALLRLQGRHHEADELTTTARRTADTYGYGGLRQRVPGRP